MATVTIKVVGSAVSAEVISTLDQAASDAMMVWLADDYGTKLDAQGNLVARTPKEMVEAAIDAIVEGTLENVNRHATKKAIEAISITPATAAVTKV